MKGGDIVDLTLKICINDGSEILVDGFDLIGFTNDVFLMEELHSGYTWQKNYPQILNIMSNHKFLIFKRHDPKDDLKYRGHLYAYKNERFQKNEDLILNTCSINTIINMYD